MNSIFFVRIDLYVNPLVVYHSNRMTVRDTTFLISSDEAPISGSIDNDLRYTFLFEIMKSGDGYDQLTSNDCQSCNIRIVSTLKEV